jgi:hypothetical protein
MLRKLTKHDPKVATNKFDPGQLFGTYRAKIVRDSDIVDLARTSEGTGPRV